MVVVVTLLAPISFPIISLKNIFRLGRLARVQGVQIRRIQDPDEFTNVINIGAYHSPRCVVKKFK
jgi:hypothetical protein